MKAVIVNSKIKERISIKLLTPLQGKLKELTEENYKKLKASILKHGFSFPIFVWQSTEDEKIYIIDGTQRFVALNKMNAEGYDIPQIPIVFIEAKSIDDAKDKLASAASSFGVFTEEGITEFFSSFNFDKTTISIPTFNFDNFVKDKVFVDGYEREKGSYTETEFPDLKNNGEPEMSQITFIVSKKQKEIINLSLSEAKKHVEDSNENMNSNGNALSLICMEYLDKNGIS